MSQILNLYCSRVSDDPVANLLYQELAPLYPALQGVRIERVLRVERKSIGLDETRKLMRLFAYPGADRATLTTIFNGNEGVVREIGYQRGWTDPELPSIMHACSALNIQRLKWARLSTRYLFRGINDAVADEIAEKYLYNPQSQMIIPVGFQWDTLMPQGDRQPEIWIDVANMSFGELLKLSEDWRIFLKEYQWVKIQAYYRKKGRKASKTEIEKIAAAFGDHCAHTTLLSLGLLQDLKRTTEAARHPLIVSCFKDNSGVFKFYGGWSIGAKGETHISPWLLDAIMAILTLHGGVERDGKGTGLGGWPILGSAIFGTRDPRIGWENLFGTIHPKTLVRGAIQATRDYCNPMGISMGWSQFVVHPRNVKAFSLGHCISLIPTKYAQKGIPNEGDYYVLFGGYTGRDGLHGAVVSGDSASQITLKADKAHVQLGFPIVQRTFMEVIPILRDEGCVSAITDLGAAGISCSAGEKGSKVRKRQEDVITSGLWLNLAWVPLKSADMDNWEIYLSESQERMTIAIRRDKLARALKIFEDYGVQYAVIGVFTSSGSCQVVYNPDIDHEAWIADPKPVMEPETIAVDLEYSFLEDIPLPHIEVKEPVRELKSFVPALPSSGDAECHEFWKDIITRFLGHYNICDQVIAKRQFDMTVQRRTYRMYVGGRDQRMPDDLTIMAPIYGKPYALGVSNLLNQLYGEIDPALQGQLAYSQSIMKLVAAGFNPAEMATCVNVYTPRVTDSPENAWNLVQLIRHGYLHAEKKLRVYVISGKDSSSGTIYLLDVRYDAPLTINVLAIGRLPDVRRTIPKPFTKPGDSIFLFRPGLVSDGLGGSIFFDMLGQKGNKLPIVDLDEQLRGMNLFHKACRKTEDLTGVIHSSSSIADGGIMRRLFEMGYGNNLGCSISLPISPELLFSEAPGIIFATEKHEWVANLPKESWQHLGHVTDEPIIAAERDGKKLFSATINDLSQEWGKTFREAIHA